MYFLANITTHYDGMEWLERGVTLAESMEEAQLKIDEEDWTHDDGIESQDRAQLQEITELEYNVLSKFLVVI